MCETRLSYGGEKKFGFMIKASLIERKHLKISWNYSTRVSFSSGGNTRIFFQTSRENKIKDGDIVLNKCKVKVILGGLKVSQMVGEQNKNCQNQTK